MAKYLLIGTNKPTWRLAVTEDIDSLDQRWQHAFDRNERLLVQVVAANELETQSLWVNPRAVPWYAVFDDGDPAQ
ncbi:hypothetical protein [Curtobacterium sp. MCBA15_012]|uniref:hypothetical protein n=1 Tax=Curtobacterium sp. MCBA15_012 TaxID=1898738 RepID=UPI0008DC7075|nr:hypothetical protein [Curtobacterium sp. MCBA15_012]WIA99733.1 hypothetical protein QOL15_14660 [Curtobacterium sp. MCBA15_012]